MKKRTNDFSSLIDIYLINTDKENPLNNLRSSSGAFDSFDECPDSVLNYFYEKIPKEIFIKHYESNWGGTKIGLKVINEFLYWKRIKNRRAIIITCDSDIKFDEDDSNCNNFKFILCDKSELTILRDNLGYLIKHKLLFKAWSDELNLKSRLLGKINLFENLYD